MKKYFNSGIFLFAMASGALVLMLSCGKKEENPPAAETAPTAKTAPAQTQIDKIVGLAYIEPVNRIITLNAKTNGLVKKVWVQSGEPLAAGQTLLEMDAAVEQAQIGQTQSKIASREAQIFAKTQTLEALKIKLENARVNFERNQKLFAGQAATAQAVDDSRFTYQNLQKEVIASEADIAQVRRSTDELRADIAYYQTLIDQKIVKAPMNGMMLSMEAKVGNSLRPETAVGEFAPDGPLMAVTEVDELFADRVKIGQTAYVRIQGTTEKVAAGKVFYTSPYLKKKSLFSDSAANLEDRRVREVRVELEAGAKVLIGSRMECVIEFK